jgi:hypothetical protein
MAIPDDPLNRWWVEANPEDNPAATDGFRQCLLIILAFGPDKEPSIAGTGFIIGYGQGFALALTAAHVLPAGVHGFQRPMQRHAGSSLFVPRSWSEPSLDPKKLKVLWAGPAAAEAVNVAHVNYNDAMDISTFLVVPQDASQKFEPAYIPIDTSVPNVGDVIHILSNGALKVEETRAPKDRDGSGQALTFERRVSLRRGVVTGVYPRGYRQFSWPCFTTSIPVPAGMSGGLAFIPRDGETIAACGVVSADPSPESAHTTFLECGESVIASTWPALCLTVPMSMGGGTADHPTATLQEMMRLGRLPMAVGGVDHIDIVTNGDGFLLRNTRVVPEYDS